MASLIEIVMPSADAETPGFRLPFPPLVPAMVAAITALAYGPFHALWPLPLTLLLAPIASLLLAVNNGQGPLRAFASAVISTATTVLLVFLIFVVAGGVAAVNCLSSSGGCLPW